jgi:hypothetical protein
LLARRGAVVFIIFKILFVDVHPTPHQVARSGAGIQPFIHRTLDTRLE